MNPIIIPPRVRDSVARLADILRRRINASAARYLANRTSVALFLAHCDVAGMATPDAYAAFEAWSRPHAPAFSRKAFNRVVRSLGRSTFELEGETVWT